MANTNDLDAVTPQVMIKVTPAMLKAYADMLHHQAKCQAEGGTKHCGEDYPDNPMTFIPAAPGMLVPKKMF